MCASLLGFNPHWGASGVKSFSGVWFVCVCVAVASVVQSCGGPCCAQLSQFGKLTLVLHTF